MFRKNEEHRQQSFFSGENLLPRKLRQRLKESWAETFYREVFCRIDEEPFALLYSDKASRPNVPVNVLVGIEIVKSGFGWSDQELYEQVCFNLQVRHALGLDDLRTEVFDLRTLYNFRKRVREYAESQGVNLFQKVFEEVTDEQLEAIALKTGWQRMDSTQVLSNLAKMSRLELIVSVVQKLYGQLDEEDQAQWQERLAPYLEGRPHQVCYPIRGDAVESHLERLGQILAELAEELRAKAPESEGAALAQRVLTEQYELQDDGTVLPRPPEAVSAESLQSPHDPEATYRVKGGTTYRGGYVVNVSETCEPENSVQLLTDLQVAPNQTDDGELLERSLEGQADRGISVEKVTVDGGYTGPTAEQTCEEHQVDLRATGMRGGRSAPDHLGWEAYTWKMDGDGQPVRVTCTEGQTTDLRPGGGEGRFIARFDRAWCAQCPLFNKRCRVVPRRGGPTFYVRERTIQVALQRQQLCPQDTPIRTVIEATIRSLKHPFPASKLPVRGLIRATMVIYGSALMVNLRRLHGYFTAEQGQQLIQAGASALLSLFSSLLTAIRAYYGRWYRFHLALPPFAHSHHARAVA